MVRLCKWYDGVWGCVNGETMCYDCVNSATVGNDRGLRGACLCIHSNTKARKVLKVPECYLYN